MWEIKFQERSSKNHAIHKVNFMVIIKVNRLMLQNILQSEQELHIGILVKLPVRQYQFYEYWATRSRDMKVQRLATAPIFAETIKVWGAISPTPGLDIDRWPVGFFYSAGQFGPVDLALHWPEGASERKFGPQGCSFCAGPKYKSD